MVMIMIALYVCNSTQIRLSFGMGRASRLCISGSMRTFVFHMERMNQNITTFCCRASYEHLLRPEFRWQYGLWRWLDWVSLISLAFFYTYCTKYKILLSPSCSAIFLRHRSIAKYSIGRMFCLASNCNSTTLTQIWHPGRIEQSLRLSEHDR